MLGAFGPSLAASQTAPSPATGSDSVVMTAGARYQAGFLRRWLLGSTYRDVWDTPVRVPVLDLRTFAGGLRPLKVGGGNQTKSLRLITPDGNEYVFRFVDKNKVQTPPAFKGTVVDKMFRDQVSASHPGAALAAAPMLEAAGVLHATPILAVLPDDTLLGQFRAEFAGHLGMIEQYPSKPKGGDGFAGARKIIDSDELLQLLNRDPSERFDARALLAARLMDMLLNDWDRHQGQWKWARFHKGAGSPWVPIPRDRDKVFITSGGLLLGLARHVAPNLAPFRASYPSVQALTVNSLEFDRRMLGGLEKPVWDSVAAELVRRVTDSVIDAAVQVLPPEYQGLTPQLAGTLKQRRDELPEAANRFYLLLAAVADLHATDAADRATITRVDDRFVDIRLESGNGEPYLRRRFDARETRDIRLYLHGGDDTAVVTGHVPRSIRVRVIGGNGTNRLIDSSSVGGHGNQAHLLDVGTVQDVAYGPDTSFNRLPWVRENGHFVIPTTDHGDSLLPVMGLTSNRDLGILPRLGVNKYEYAFRRRPYSSLTGLHAEYATKVDGFRIGVATDRRRESSPLHFIAVARMSELEVISFHGLGNETPDTTTAYYDVRQQQWLLQAGLAWALGSRSDLALGPALQYSTTDSTPDRFISATQPYGFGNFGEAGLRLVFRHDSRDQRAEPHRGFLVDVSGGFYPALWDVTSPFGTVAASAATFVTFPIPMHPILVLRGGAKQVFGEYPFHDAAFIGGRATLRSLDAQRYAGDASLYGTVELRLPVAKFAFVLPLDMGLFGIVDVGRVYVDGDSPGGWHTATGVGFWIGILNPDNSIRICRRPGASGPC